MDMTTKVARRIPGPPTPELDSGLGIEAFRAIDRMREALAGQFTAGLSPAALALAFYDWGIHLAAAPGKQMELGWKAGRKVARLGAHLLPASAVPEAAACIEPLPGDDRFRAPSWRRQPFCLLSQAFLLQQQWWHN
ncbi:MAG: poly-beta-hydroxybutyrate polymerase, partial [Betaproteobacteria bacterium]